MFSGVSHNIQDKIAAWACEIIKIGKFNEHKTVQYANVNKQTDESVVL